MTDTKTLVEEARRFESIEASLFPKDTEKAMRRLADALEAAEQEADALAAVVEKVREARANHPECEKHAGDDAVSCGWKSAVLDIDDALGAAPADALREHDAQVRAEAIRSARDGIMPPYNFELRSDGTESPELAAYVEIMHEVHDRLSEVADRIEKEAVL